MLWRYDVDWFQIYSSEFFPFQLVTIVILYLYYYIIIIVYNAITIILYFAPNVPILLISNLNEVAIKYLRHCNVST